MFILRRVFGSIHGDMTCHVAANQKGVYDEESVTTFR